MEFKDFFIACREHISSSYVAGAAGLLVSSGLVVGFLFYVVDLYLLFFKPQRG